MNAPLPLHPGPAVGFETPFEMLEACHQRVQRSLALLQRLLDHLPRHGTDEQARDAARDVMRYFDLAGPAHHEDEERHILPRLRALGQAALADRLHAEHEKMSASWQGVRGDLAAIAEGRWSPADQHDAVARARDFAALYAGHIEAEESHAYPACRTGLGADDQAAMGCEMAARRQPGTAQG